MCNATFDPVPIRITHHDLYVTITLMEEKWNSRKYQSAWKLTWLATGLLVLPWVANVIFGLTLVMLMDASILAMLIISIWGAYFASNVTEKHNAFLSNTIHTQKTTKSSTTTINPDEVG